MLYKDTIEFTISTPYQLSNTDQILIGVGQQNRFEWSHAHYTDLKERIRKHLRPLQKGRCAFCRLRIPTSQFYPHLEHLVPKGARPEFTFLPINLVWSCQKCNFGKGTRNTLVQPQMNPYPFQTTAFNILNPYYDSFFHHFDLIEDLIIVVIDNSEKAKNTYEFYKLDRIEIAEDRAFELKTIFQNLTKEEIVEKLILRLTKENDKRIVELIEYYLQKIPNWVI